jgi:hypothetical protein
MIVHLFILIAAYVATPSLPTDHQAQVGALAQAYSTQAQCMAAATALLAKANAEQPEELLGLKVSCIAIDVPIPAGKEI